MNTKMHRIMSASVCQYLSSALCRYDNVKLIDAVIRRREAACLLLEGTADVGDDTVKDDVRVLGNGTKVLRQSHEERHFLGGVWRVTC